MINILIGLFFLVEPAGPQKYLTSSIPIFRTIHQYIIFERKTSNFCLSQLHNLLKIHPIYVHVIWAPSSLVKFENPLTAIPNLWNTTQKAGT